MLFIYEILTILFILMLISMRQLLVENQQLKKNAEILTKKAQLDSLTQLYNHGTTQELIDVFLNMEQLKGKEGMEEIHGLFVMDVDDFKEINDRLGHDMGDCVLQDLAKRLKETFRKTDIVGRIGGDEFVVFVKNVSSKEQIIAFANKIMEKTTTTYEKDDMEIKVTISIGIAVFCGGKMDFQTLYQKADGALYDVKRNSKNGYHIIDFSFNCEQKLNKK